MICKENTEAHKIWHKDKLYNIYAPESWIRLFIVIARFCCFISAYYNVIQIVQLSNGIFLLKRVSRYGRCFMIDSGSKGCPEQESAGCHFGTLGRNFLRAKTKWPPNISRSNLIFQLMEPGTSVIPHFYVILTEQSISCIILMTQGHLQGQKDNFKVKEVKIQFLTNKDRNMCNTSFTWDFIWKWMYVIILLIQG